MSSAKLNIPGRLLNYVMHAVGSRTLALSNLFVKASGMTFNGVCTHINTKRTKGTSQTTQVLGELVTYKKLVGGKTFSFREYNYSSSFFP